MRLLLHLGTGLYHAGIRLAAPFVPKARAWVRGRRGLWPRLEARAAGLQGCIWMHCASVGEFEQGRPVLEAVRRAHPQRPVLLTFHSPSGHQAFHGSDAAHHVEYLPADTARNARRLVRLLRPHAVLWVKYEFWPRHLHALHRAGVPVYLLSAIFRPGQPFFRWYGAGHRRMLRAFAHLFVQDERSRALLHGIGVGDVTVSGDTRFDRVAGIAAAPPDLPMAAAFKGAARMVVCGSTWPADERLLATAMDGLPVPVKWLVVPHEPTAEHLRGIEARFPKPLVRWSELEGTTAENVAATLGREPQGTLVVDRTGLLARLYAHGDLAYVGGGFGAGVHSILEPAAWGLPVLFGPRHHKFAEAEAIVRAGGGRAVGHVAALRDALDRWTGDPAERRRAGEAARRYVADQAGATDRIMAVLKDRL